MFRLLLDSLEEYLIPALQIALEDYNDKDGKPDFEILGVTKVCLNVLQLVQLHFQSIILAHVIPAPALHREIILDKNEVFAGVEGLCCDLVERVVGSCVKALGSILGRQKKGDFFKVDEIGTGTGVCDEACEFIQTLTGEVGLYLNGANYTAVLIEVGSAFHT
jgi:hypothetical protein